MPARVIAISKVVMRRVNEGFTSDKTCWWVGRLRWWPDAGSSRGGCSCSSCRRGLAFTPMGMPELPRDTESRLAAVEDAVQEFRFVHMTKTDAQSTGMGLLYAGQQRLEHMLVGFRAEAAAEFGAVHAELAEIKSTMAEVLRRLPEPDQPS